MQPWNNSSLEFVTLTNLTMSLIFSKASLITANPSWTIRFRICAAHLKWKNSPLQTKFFLSFFFRTPCMLSLEEALSTVIVIFFHYCPIKASSVWKLNYWTSRLVTILWIYRHARIKRKVEKIRRLEVFDTIKDDEFFLRRLLHLHV